MLLSVYDSLAKMEDGKKISFGFSKISKKPTVLSKPEQKKIELVECLEGQSIKIKDAVEIIDEPLVIPLKDDQKNLLDRIRNAKAKQNKKEETEDERPDSELTIEELAVREVIREAKNRLSEKSKDSGKVFTLPTKEDELILEGEKEPTLDDYENVPIGDFGMAMLRGMGWKQGMGIGKNASKIAAVTAPELRPKGLGLGASRLVADTPKSKTDKDGKELVLVKGSLAKIIAGPQKGNYCEILGFDDEAGRVIVKTSIKSEILNLNEFMLVPVTKEEFSKGAKVLNNAKYEEYKEKSDKNLEKFKNNRSESPVEKNGNSLEKYPVKKEKTHYSSDEDKYKPQSSKYKPKKHNSKYSSSTDEDSSSEDEKRSKKVEKKREKSRNRSSSSSEEEYTRRNEKKTKSSRRDRSRSRNHKSKSKHRHRSSSSDEDHKRRNKKNKCKSRHRRSSSTEDRKHRKSKR